MQDQYTQHRGDAAAWNKASREKEARSIHVSFVQEYLGGAYLRWGFRCPLLSLAHEDDGRELER